MLAHPDFSRPLILSIDASLDGLGAVLSQVPAGEEIARPIAFTSKTLTASQKKYPAHRLEFLALKWSVCEKFSHWLKGHSFTVWTDNNPLTHIMTKPKLNACEQRWVSKLALYFFDIKHIAGVKNIVADTLSRDPFARSISHRLMNESYNHLLTEADVVEKEGIQDVFHLKVECHKISDQIGCQSSCHVQSCDPSAVKTLCQAQDDWETAAVTRAVQLVQLVQQVAATNQSEQPLPVFSHDELRVKSLTLPFPRFSLLYFVKDVLQDKRERSSTTELWLLSSNHLYMCDGILYRVTKDPISRQRRHQYVLPQNMVEKALHGLHDLAGHQ